MEYNEIDHRHCPSTNSPCGIEGEHRCCLCGRDLKMLMKYPHPPKTQTTYCYCQECYRAYKNKKAHDTNNQHHTMTNKPNNKVEEIAQKLHEWYLEATDQDGAKYNYEAVVPYEDLPEGSKLLDRYIAKKVVELCTSSYEQATREAIDLAEQIERQEPDGGTAQWKAFKRFLKTLRDKLVS